MWLEPEHDLVDRGGARRRPTLGLLFQIARTLDVPIQRLVGGADRPVNELREIAVELRNVGIEDLWVRDAVVPCAFRRPEAVIVLAVCGEPDARILEALPAVLAWNAWDRRLLRAFSREAEPRPRVIYRLAWLADIALAIERRRGFPGGCRSGQLIDFVRSLKRPESKHWDGLGRPMVNEPRSTIWRRWKIRYDAGLEEFEKRAEALAELRQRGHGRLMHSGRGRRPSGEVETL